MARDLADIQTCCLVIGWVWGGARVAVIGLRNREELRAFVSRAMKLGVAHNVANFCARLEKISFRRCAPMRGISQDYCLYSLFPNHSNNNSHVTGPWNNKKSCFLSAMAVPICVNNSSAISRRLIFRGHGRFCSQKWHFSDGHNDIYCPLLPSVAATVLEARRILPARLFCMFLECEVIKV